MKRSFFFAVALSLTAVTAFAFKSSKALLNEGLYADMGGGSFKQLSNETSSTPSGADIQVGSTRAITLTTPAGTYNLIYKNSSGVPQQVETKNSSW